MTSSNRPRSTLIQPLRSVSHTNFFTTYTSLPTYHVIIHFQFQKSPSSPGIHTSISHQSQHFITLTSSTNLLLSTLLSHHNHANSPNCRDILKPSPIDAQHYSTVRLHHQLLHHLHEPTDSFLILSTVIFI